jgi:hypothetical protein
MSIYTLSVAWERLDKQAIHRNYDSKGSVAQKNL